MWTAKILFFFLLIAAVKSIIWFHFSHITCAEIFALKIFRGQTTTLKDAYEKCVNNPECVGINKTSATTFQLLNHLHGYTRTSKPTNYYIYDRNNGTSLSNAPSKIDAAVLFSIYLYGECPVYLSLQNSMCSGITADFLCKKYPSYMNATWTDIGVAGGSTNVNCTVVPKSALSKKWS